jgi:hypothetical protein
MPEDYSFSKKGLIEKNMQDVYNYLIEEGSNQMVILVIGDPNTAKSTLSTYIVRYLKQGEPELDHYAFDHDQWHSMHTSRPKNKFEIYEEGRDSFYRRNHSTNENKQAMNALMHYRKYQHVLFLNFQNITDLEPDIALNVAHGCFRCTKKGWTWFYSQASLREMFDGRQFTGWDDPDFKDGFPDPEEEIPEFWKKYEENAVEVLDEREEEEDDAEWLTPGEFGELVGYSAETVRNKIKDGEICAMKRGDQFIIDKNERQKLVEEYKPEN